MNLQGQVYSSNLFTHHGPVIYSDTYKVFQSLLREMNVDFYDLFVKSNFTIMQIGGETIFSTLSFSELSQLAFEFIILLFNENHGENINLGEYIKNFKESSKEIIDRLCKLTDGGGIDKFTLNEFLQIFNQNFFHSLYQPKLPNDIRLFKIWKEYLENKGVEFILNSKITKININNNSIRSINTYGNTIYGKEFVFAIPPVNLNELILKNNIPHNWGNMQQFAKDTEYITYIPISFHWNKKLDLKKIYGFPKTEWGIAFVVMTDYTSFAENDSQTVISSAITIVDIPNSSGKTANQSSRQELIHQVFSVLKSIYPELPEPTASIISPEITFDTLENRYKSIDTAFINTSKSRNLQFQNGKVQNMYTLGTHNGKSLYKFTSLESAVTNGVMLSKIICSGNSKIELTKSTSISDIFRISVIIILLSILLFTTQNLLHIRRT